MKKLFYLILTVLIISGCASGKKALERGDYDLAVEQAVKRLRSNSSNDKARKTLKKAYKYGTRFHQDNIVQITRSTDIYKWERLVEEYHLTNDYYESIRRCPPCLELVGTPINYVTELESALSKAAEVRYDLGVKALSQKDIRIKAIEAHQHLTQASYYRPQFKDVEERIAESLFHATLKVVVEPLKQPSMNLALKNEFFMNKLYEYLDNNRINPYIRFYRPEQAENLPYVDQVIKMEFERFNLSNLSTNTFEKGVSRDSVLIGQQNGQDVFGTVKAKLKVTELNITGRSLLDFKVKDLNNGTIITQEKMPASYTWSASWARYNGDERALSEEDLELVDRPIRSKPGNQFLYEEMMAVLFDQVTHKLVTFYRNY